ncbi:ATP-binding protein [Rhodonellum psychrophilum GCM71 = DSM 17998]|uniref:ATP-binding protein n=2 Tax=Rhodonellum TaxID=336827 RepID=U5BRW0_9BACT|nr:MULTISPECIES: ABC transporter ATP-binding protein [Rhodonellum]ERM80259.1 ATP-binding protein [Rhodonellum psychrophilum GCM71 = DSM 17998]MDO9553765.1 ABC transporter ATP-binding protein [Rhodonellum sp.]SDY95104.1 ABC-2 type transport system ATP-binding protein [Rhodonellum ikkaensis]
MISIQGLKKQYKEAIVLDVESLDISKNQCFGLVGNNGAGKTTLFRIMLDLVRASAGAVMVDGEDVSKGEAWKSKVGAFLDEHMLLSYLTPDEYFETLRKIYGLSKEDLMLHLDKFTEFFNGEILGKKKYIRDLSKGNLKKVGIVAAMMGNPDVVMLDEPFENLDPSSQNRLKKLVVQESPNTTFLISSHDLVHVTEICDRIVLLEKGKVIKDLQEKELMVEELNTYFGT